MSFLNIKLYIFNSNSIKTVATSFIFFLLLSIVLFIRGEGWDGDSLVNIAQFNKLVFFDLYGVPDSGTTPKLLPITLFGTFHFVFNSYSIHWPVILLSSFAFAKIALLPKAEGGGFLWFFLPFISPALIFSIVSADNPGLAIPFYILAITFAFEKKISLSFVFLLLAEFSRPGYSVLMVLTLFFFIFNGSLNINKDKKKIIGIFILILFAFCHSLYCYKLGYPNFDEYNLNNWNTFRKGNDEGINFFLNNKSITLLVFFNGFLAAIFSNNIIPFPFSIIAILILILSFKKLKNISTILFLLPVIYFPFLFAALTKGMIMPDYRNPYFFKNLYASDPYYFITLTPVLLFGISIFIGQIVLKKSTFHNLNILKTYKKKFYFSEFLTKFFGYLYLPKVAIIIALILSFANGIMLKGRYEFNPVQSNSIKSKYSHIWLSDPLANKKFSETFKSKGKKLSVLVTCDVIPILIDSAAYIKKISYASTDIYFNKENTEFIGSCYKSHFLKRSNDVLLDKNQEYKMSNIFDILYTTTDMLKYFEIPPNAKKIILDINRVMIIN